MPNKIKWIYSACSTATIALALLCIMCGTAFSATPITFWTTEVSPDRQEVIGYLVRAFEIHYPDIKVKVVGVEENRIASELAKVRKIGKGPDVIGCASDLVVAFNNHGWMNTRETGRVIAGIGRNNFFAGALRKVRVGENTFCGIPFNGWVQGIWYRKDWFNEKKLPPPDNWENILRAASEFHDPENNRYGILIGTRPDSYAEQVFSHLALSAGVKEFTQNGTVLFDSPAAVKTLEFYKKLSVYSPPGPDWWRGRDFFMQGKMAMMFYSTFIMDDLAIPAIAEDSLSGYNFQELKGADYDYDLLQNTDMVSTISDDRPAGYGVIHALGLLKTNNNEKQEAAGCFVNFLFQEDAYITWLHMVPGGMLPVLKKISANPIFYRDSQGVFHKYSRQRIRAIVSGFDNLKSFDFDGGELIPMAAAATEQGIIPNMIDRALNKGVPVKDAVKDAAEQMKKISAVRK